MLRHFIGQDWLNVINIIGAQVCYGQPTFRHFCLLSFCCLVLMWATVMAHFILVYSTLLWKLFGSRPTSQFALMRSAACDGKGISFWLSLLSSYHLDLLVRDDAREEKESLQFSWVVSIVCCIPSRTVYTERTYSQLQGGGLLAPALGGGGARWQLHRDPRDGSFTDPQFQRYVRYQISWDSAVPKERRTAQEAAKAQEAPKAEVAVGESWTQVTAARPLLCPTSSPMGVPLAGFSHVGQDGARLAGVMVTFSRSLVFLRGSRLVCRASHSSFTGAAVVGNEVNKSIAPRNPTCGTHVPGSADFPPFHCGCKTGCPSIVSALFSSVFGQDRAEALLDHHAEGQRALADVLCDRDKFRCFPRARVWWLITRVTWSLFSFWSPMLRQRTQSTSYLDEGSALQGRSTSESWSDEDVVVNKIPREWVLLEIFNNVNDEWLWGSQLKTKKNGRICGWNVSRRVDRSLCSRKWNSSEDSTFPVMDRCFDTSTRSWSTIG